MTYPEFSVYLCFNFPSFSSLFQSLQVLKVNINNILSVLYIYGSGA